MHIDNRNETDKGVLLYNTSEAMYVEVQNWLTNAHRYEGDWTGFMRFASRELAEAYCLINSLTLTQKNNQDETT